jgi:hypothetical protein
MGAAKKNEQITHQKSVDTGHENSSKAVMNGIDV